MRLKFGSTLLLAALLCAGIPAATSASASARRSSEDRAFAELQRAVRQRVDTHNSTGIVAGLLTSDGRTRLVAYGRAAGADRVTADSLFEIGSITKVFTGTLLADMAQRGEVALDEPVASLLPPGVKVPSRHGRQITLADLATHTSGLPREATNLAPKDPTQPYADYTVDRLYDFLSHAKLTRDPGAQFLYSNVGGGLLGHALSLRAGRSYEQLLRERIVDPLGMGTTTTALTPAVRQRLVVGHDLVGDPLAPLRMAVLAPAGALRSTAGGMLRFAAANLSGSGDGVLDRAMAIARAPRHAADEADRIGLHWITTPLHGRDIVWHDGATLGQHSFLGLDPARRTAVIVLSGSVIDVSDIGLHALDPKSPLERLPKAVSLPARTLARYAGTYRFPTGERVRITRSRRGLLARQRGFPPLRLTPESSTRFFVNMAVRVRFRLLHGRATSVVLSLDGLEQAARRVG